jgi:excinuclease ABC subunit C
VRDEAHRFAITYHRSRRDKAMTRSVLDDIPGLGPGRRTRLLKEFGSVKKIRALTEEELVAIRWLPETVGRRVYERLHTPSPPARSPAPVTVSSWSRDE